MKKSQEQIKKEQDLVILMMPIGQQVARKYFVAPEEIEDAIHDSIVKALESYHTLQKEESVDAWFRKIANNHCKDIKKKENVRRKVHAYGVDPENVDITEDKADFLPVTYLEKEQINLQLRTLIDDLPDLQRQVIHLKFFLNYSTAQIAHSLNMASKSVENALYRAKINLKRKVDAHPELWAIPGVRQILQYSIELSQLTPAQITIIWNRLALSLQWVSHSIPIITLIAKSIKDKLSRAAALPTAAKVSVVGGAILAAISGGVLLTNSDGKEALPMHLPISQLETEQSLNPRLESHPIDKQQEVSRSDNREVSHLSMERVSLSRDIEGSESQLSLESEPIIELELEPELAPEIQPPPKENSSPSRDKESSYAIRPPFSPVPELNAESESEPELASEPDEPESTPPVLGQSGS